MKKAIFLFATLLALGKTALAYDFSAVAPTGQTLYYNISDSGASVTYPGWYSSDNSYYPSDYFTKPTGNLIIPSSVTVGGLTYAVTSIGDWAFGGCSGLTSVSIPNTVTIIGFCSFQFCSGLTSVTIPSSVTLIDSYAFAGCSSLTSVTIPNSVTIAGTHVFGNCNSLTSPVYNNTLFFKMPNFYGTYAIPSGITTICGGAFSGRSGMTAITIPSSVTSIGNAAFSDCTGLTAISIPDSVTSISGYTFDGCTSLTAISIPESVTSIGPYAFRGCTGLASITIPSVVANIGQGAFSNCINLTEIHSDASVAPLLGTNAFQSVPTSIEIHIPCGSVMSYYSRWSYFSNFIENEGFYFSVTTADSIQGHVTVLTFPTCQTPTSVFYAEANSGYLFDHWSDGFTDNPRSLTLSSDTAIVAYFSQGTSDYNTIYDTIIIHDTTFVAVHDTVTVTDTLWLTQVDTVWLHDTVVIHDTVYITQEGIGDVDALNAKVYTSQGQIVVEGADGNMVTLYDVTGRVLATRRDEYAPLRFDASASGTYMLRIGNHPARKVVVTR